RRSDLYSLGCILYEMVAGSPPFRGGTASAVVAKHLGEPPAALPPSVPGWLRDLIDRLLAKRPADRPATARHRRHTLTHARRSVWRRIRAPLAVLGIVGAIAVGVAATGGDQACGDDPAALWTAAARARVPQPARSTYDAKASEIGARHREGCTKRAGGEL